MIVILLFIGIIFFYLCMTRNYSYWSKRNVVFEKPIPIFGNTFKNQIGTKSITQLAEELYFKYPNEKVIGYYRWMTPELIVRDPDIIKQILSSDFPYFYKRGLGRDVNVEPLLDNIFHADGDSWKLLRQRLTPAFTTAKLKNMFPLVVRCAEKLQMTAEDVASQGKECDVRELMARFTTEFIGACGFGIEMDTINNEQSQFRNIGKMIFTRSFREIALFTLYEGLPMFRKYIKVIDPKLDAAILNIFCQIRNQRNNKPSGRHDFIDLLLELETKGKIKGNSIEKRNPDGSPVEVEIEMSLERMAAQVFIFFAAGFETSSSATSYTLHELAFNPEIQSEIQKEIDEVLLKYDNKLCYDAIAEMSLLDMAFKEAMRIFPSLGVLNRICTRSYTIPELNIKLDPGVRIVIPIQAIQHDQKYFEDPFQFKLERFTPEAIKYRHNYTYLPFGEGPRACIGARLGQMQSLAGLAALLHKFTVEPSNNTIRHPEVNPNFNVTQTLKGGLPLKLKLRTNKTVRN